MGYFIVGTPRQTRDGLWYATKPGKRGISLWVQDRTFAHRFSDPYTANWHASSYAEQFPYGSMTNIGVEKLP